MIHQTVQRQGTISKIFISKTEKRMRAFWRLVAQYVLNKVIILLLGGLVYLVVVKLLDKSIDQILGSAIGFIGITLSVFVARRYLDRRPFLSLGLTIDRSSLQDVITGFGVAGLLIAGIFWTELGFGWLRVEEFAWQQMPPMKLAGDLLLMLLLFMMVGWQEELQYRGYSLHNLENGLNRSWGVGLSSLIFAISHLSNPNISIVAIFGLIFSGVFLAFPFILTRRLWLSIGLHTGWNFFEGTIFGFQVSGLSGMPRLIVQSVDGPTLITGGEFGPEAGIILYPIIILGCLIIAIYYKYLRV
jgi:membrane protease YdiL (CAAX protease family)